MRLHHVQVACPPGGEDAVRRFYADGLGLREVEKPEALRARGGAWFRSYGQDGDVTAELHVGVEEPFAPARKAHPGLVVDDFDDVRARLAAAGHEPEDDAKIEGVRRLFVHDPFGNRLEVRQR